MQTLILILIAALSFCVICLGTVCFFMDREIRNLNKQLIDARSEYRCHIEWVKTKLYVYRQKRSNQGGDGGKDCCGKCNIFD